MDLKFPHHECEIAQNMGAHGPEQPVKYWLHGNMLTVNGRKMSKSEGNGFTPEELITGNHKLLEKGYSPMTVRFFMLQGHYAGTLDFSNPALQAAEKGLERLMAAWGLLDGLAPVTGAEAQPDLDSLRTRAYAAMNDDFNTPVLIAVLYDAVKVVNSVADGRMSMDAEGIDALRALFADFAQDVLGLEQEGESEGGSDRTDGLMEVLCALRAEAKANKDWATADLIRDRLGAIGVQIKDGKDGTSWTFD